MNEINCSNQSLSKMFAASAANVSTQQIAQTNWNGKRKCLSCYCDRERRETSNLFSEIRNSSCAWLQPRVRQCESKVRFCLNKVCGKHVHDLSHRISLGRQGNVTTFPRITSWQRDFNEIIDCKLMRRDGCRWYNKITWI